MIACTWASPPAAGALSVPCLSGVAAVAWCMPGAERGLPRPRFC